MGEKIVRKTIVLSGELNNQMGKYAQVNDMSDSQVIRLALRDLVQKQQDSLSSPEALPKSVDELFKGKDSKEALAELKKIVDKLVEKM